MAFKADIEQLQSERKQVYLASPKEIISRYNNEIGTVKEYRNRELFELIQNADDEAHEKKGEMLITYDGTVLTVANTGTAFTVDGISSLMIPEMSAKKKKTDKIGNKGLGFRSVLNWSERIRIISNGLEIEFSKDIAIGFLKSLCMEEQKVADEIARNKHLGEHPIATLAYPKVSEANDDRYRDYDTYIILDCKEEYRDNIYKQIESLSIEELLFLNNLKK